MNMELIAVFCGAGALVLAALLGSALYHSSDLDDADEMQDQDNWGR